MSTLSETLKKKLVDELQATHVEVTDLSSGCGQNIEVTIVSSQFEGKRLLQRHTLVNKVLKDEIAGIHAFSQKPLTPAEWTKRQPSA
ncbi:hypothetical protein IWQ61_000857 [Dispira simplex]|nr:hypothetical protein IWQ61_003962 [Dispira simplex]KAJ1660176.1 hypothetical protein IWQ61_000857 [Dispira simplex]